ncbi:pH regulation protein F [bacterium]|mgnify:CR=1 FL=1|jgi:multicomponent Na+:H+ antiporter subunit F|nr:pH regulation protein F [bacterium]|tara:strand:+ start:150 stop:407 length:258 start_codon:yes stop_codon:yes gene_type:complete
MIELIIIVILAILPLRLLLKGSSPYERLIGLNVFSNKVLVLILLLGLSYNEINFFIDVAIGYALLNFIGVVVLTRFLRMREKGNG